MYVLYHLDVYECTTYYIYFSNLERGRKIAGSSREVHTLDIIDESITFVRRKKSVPRSLLSGMGMYIIWKLFFQHKLWHITKAFIYWSENYLLCNAEPHSTITIKFAQCALDMNWQKPSVTSNIPLFKWNSTNRFLKFVQCIGQQPSSLLGK